MSKKHSVSGNMTNKDGGAGWPCAFLRREGTIKYWKGAVEVRDVTHHYSSPDRADCRSFAGFPSPLRQRVHRIGLGNSRTWDFTHNSLLFISYSWLRFRQDSAMSEETRLAVHSCLFHISDSLPRRVMWMSDSFFFIFYFFRLYRRLTEWFSCCSSAC